jgi:hypothetical protein
MRNLIIVLFIAMLVLHQDAWNWGNEALLFGFLPVALAYHAVFALCCAGLGYLAIRYAWPHQQERLSDSPPDS